MGFKVRDVVAKDGKTIHLKADIYLDTDNAMRGRGNRKQFFLGPEFRIKPGMKKAEKEAIRRRAEKAVEEKFRDMCSTGVVDFRKRGTIDIVAYIEELAKHHKGMATVAKHLKGFLGATKLDAPAASDGHRKTPISSVDVVWCEQFRAYLLGQVALREKYQEKTIRQEHRQRHELKGVLIPGMARSSASTLWITFGKAMRMATEEPVRIIEQNPVRFVKGISMPTAFHVEYLQRSEVERLMRTPYPPLDDDGEPICPRNSDLHKMLDARRAFIFSCFTSLRYSDLRVINARNLIDNGNGVYMLDQSIIKTGTQAALELHKNAQAVIQRIIDDNDRWSSGKPFFDLYTNANMNTHIKRWMKLAGIERNITMNSARHTFAITSLVSGMDLAMVSTMMSHTSIETTHRHYAHIVESLKSQHSQLVPEYPWVDIVNDPTV